MVFLLRQCRLRKNYADLVMEQGWIAGSCRVRGRCSPQRMRKDVSMACHARIGTGLVQNLLIDVPFSTPTPVVFTLSWWSGLMNVNVPVGGTPGAGLGASPAMVKTMLDDDRFLPL